MTTVNRTPEDLDADKKRIGQALRTARYAKELTINQVVDQVRAAGYTKINPMMYSAWELGQRGAPYATVAGLSAVLDLDPAELWLPEYGVPKPTAR